MTIALVCLVALLAFANGANDNSKGVATLVGFGAARPIAALIYATVATILGGVVSFFLAAGMLKGFSGEWLFAKGIVLNQGFYVAVLIGACGWVLLANKTGMPVSTTHAIIGALCGAGIVSFGNAKFQWGMLGQKFAVPLAISPVLSLVIVYLIAWPVLFLVAWLAHRPAKADEREPFANADRSESFSTAGGDSSVAVMEHLRIDPAVDNKSVSPVVNAVHWLSGGMISFARGWNDTPKIAALSVLALSSVAHGTVIGFAIVTIAMAIGGLTMGRKVLETLSKKLTPLPRVESLTASLVTATLVGLASWITLPVSTTHVATGSIIGAGLKNNGKGVKWAKVGEIALSWIITLPVAAGIAIIAKLIIR